MPNELYQLRTLPNELYQLGTLPNELYQLRTLPNELYQLRTLPNELYQLRTLPNELYQLGTLPNYDLRVNGGPLQVVMETQFLGVTFNNKLSFITHIKDIHVLCEDNTILWISKLS